MKAAWFALLAPVMLLGQMPPIGTIEIYGLHKVSSREVLRAIGVKEGDPPRAAVRRANRRYSSASKKKVRRASSFAPLRKATSA